MVRVRGRQGPTIFLAASERDFWTCYLHPASNDFLLIYTRFHVYIEYVTVPSKSNEMGGCNLERKCATASSVPQHIAVHTSALDYARQSRCFCSIRSHIMF